jgi:hypothetical protein
VEAASAVSIRPQKLYISNNYLDFLGEFEAIFETALAHEKTEGRKSHDTVPLNLKHFLATIFLWNLMTFELR